MNKKNDQLAEDMGDNGNTSRFHPVKIIAANSVLFFILLLSIFRNWLYDHKIFFIRNKASVSGN